jgi:starch phosphorylase
VAFSSEKIVIQKFTVVPRVPERLRPLMAIARNLWWTWNPNAMALFRRIDIDLWEETRHNPILMLGTLAPERLQGLVEDDAFIAHMDSIHKDLQTYIDYPTWFSKVYGGHMDIKIAYFSMEFGFHECLPLYSGGLGVLSGDHMKSVSDLGLPLVGVGLCYQQGYYSQVLNLDGWQQEHYPDNDFYNMPITLVRDPEGRDISVEVTLPGRKVRIRIWRLAIGRTQLYLLDTNLPDNAPNDREITSRLYGGDLDMRIRQEIVLGIGGIRALTKLGIQPTVCHMNEGHAAFMSLERIKNLMGQNRLNFYDAREAVAAGNVFTTHTPVPAGNDRFPPDMIRYYFNDLIKDLGIPLDTFLGLGRVDPRDGREEFCMTVLALRLSAYANGVSRLHGRISRRMWRRIWPGVPEREIPITSITNGVHIHTWLSDEFARLYDRYLGPRWLDEPLNQRIWERVGEIPDSELWRAKERLRERLVTFTRGRLKQQLERFGSHRVKFAAVEEALDPEILTIGFARRFATYKRATLILRELPRLRKLLLDRERPLQLVFAGKAHPHDHPAKELIRQVAQLAREDELKHRIVFLEDYDHEIAHHMVQGVDVWLNTPRRPLEASGTSGMKVPINGGINLSVLDGWWCEGYRGDNGWAIGAGEEYEEKDLEYQDQVESSSLYEIIEKEVIPLFYQRGPDGLPREWIKVMKASIRTLCPVFNTNRMVEEYAERMYLPAAIQNSLLMRKEFEAAKALAAWKGRIQDRWHEVRILKVEANTASELEIGSDLEVQVQLNLGPIPPGEVSVEILHGPMDKDGEIVTGDALPLNHHSSRDSVATFVGAIPCHAAGRHGFMVRVLPFRRELAHKFETGRITWWTGDAAVPPEVVAEKVVSYGD